MSDNGSGTGEHPSEERILAGLRELHERLDELQREALAARAAEAPAPPTPAWRRQSQGEARWQVALCTAIAIALQLAVPSRLGPVSPSWVFPAAEALLLVGLVAASPRRIDQESRALRGLSLAMAAVLSLANAWAATRLVIELANGTGPAGAARLLAIGGSIWLTNVIVFALWYWEFDQDGPVARALGTASRPPDFMFPQMTVADNPHLVPPDWNPSFIDYFYLSFTNATAFSPTDTMPMTRWAKLAMTLQSAVSLVTAALVVARAVNILR